MRWIALAMLLQLLLGCDFDFESPLTRAHTGKCDPRLAGLWAMMEPGEDKGFILQVDVSKDCRKATITHSVGSSSNGALTREKPVPMTAIFASMDTGDYVSLYTDHKINRKKRFLIAKYELQDANTLRISLPDRKFLRKAVAGGLVKGVDRTNMLFDIDINGKDSDMLRFIMKYDGKIFTEWHPCERYRVPARTGT